MFQRLKSLFAMQPVRDVEFRHPEFGVLTCDSGIWSGDAQLDGRTVRFSIGGTEIAPDAGLLDRVRELLGRFPEAEWRAIEFLCSLDSHVRKEDIEFDSLDFLWVDQPQLYALEFTLAGDEDGIWRVQCEGGQPMSVGRDD